MKQLMLTKLNNKLSKTNIKYAIYAICNKQEPLR